MIRTSKPKVSRYDCLFDMLSVVAGKAQSNINGRWKLALIAHVL